MTIFLAALLGATCGILALMFACHKCATAFTVIRCFVCAICSSFAFVALYLSYAISAQSIAYAFVVSLLVCISCFDYFTRTIPNLLSASIALTWVGFVVAQAFTGAAMLPAFVQGLVSCAACALVLFLVVTAFEKLSGRTALGGSDIKLYLACSLFFNFPTAVLNIALSSVFGLVFGIISSRIQANRNTSLLQHSFPFGPSIALSTAILLIAGNVSL